MQSKHGTVHSCFDGMRADLQEGIWMCILGHLISFPGIHIITVFHTTSASNVFWYTLPRSHSSNSFFLWYLTSCIFCFLWTCTDGHGQSQVLRGAVRSRFWRRDGCRLVVLPCLHQTGCVTLGRVSPLHTQFFTCACYLHCIFFSGDFHFIAFLLAFLAQPECNLN